MKQYLFLIAIAFVFGSCQQTSEEIKPIVFSGQITNASSDKDSITLSKNNESVKIGVNEDGTFESEVNLGNGYYNFNYKRQYTNLYLENGNHTVFNTDYENFDSTLVYSGDLKETNNYMNQKIFKDQEFDSKMGFRDLYKLEEGEFTQELESRKNTLLSQLESAGVSEKFKALQKKNIVYEYISMAKRYGTYKSYFTGDTEFAPSEEFNKQFESVDYNNEEEFVNLPEYNSLVKDHFSDGDLKGCLEKLNPEISPVIRNEVLADMERFYISPNIEDLPSAIEKMKSLATDEALIDKIDGTFQKVNLLTKGNISPGFNYKNVKGGFVDLENLKGKNVYIDVWATWCGPCKAEIPHLKKLEEEFHGNNIEFVSISVDEPKDEDKWEKMIADKELKGVQLLSDNGWKTDFVENYLIKGIPRFILLDDEGKIVTADAPRPSSDTEIKDMIKEIL